MKGPKTIPDHSGDDCGGTKTPKGLLNREQAKCFWISAELTCCHIRWILDLMSQTLKRRGVFEISSLIFSRSLPKESLHSIAQVLLIILSRCTTTANGIFWRIAPLSVAALLKLRSKSDIDSQWRTDFEIPMNKVRLKRDLQTLCVSLISNCNI